MMARPPLPDQFIGTHPLAVRARLEAFERVMESAFTIPGTNRKVGLDVILDIVPVVGNMAGAALGAYMIWEARNLKLSRWGKTRMAGNVAADFMLGLIPWVGAIPDFFFRSNSRNLKIIKKHLDKHYPETGIIETSARPVDPVEPFQPLS